MQTVVAQWGWQENHFRLLTRLWRDVHLACSSKYCFLPIHQAKAGADSSLPQMMPTDDHRTLGSLGQSLQRLTKRKTIRRIVPGINIISVLCKLSPSLSQKKSRKITMFRARARACKTKERQDAPFSRLIFHFINPGKDWFCCLLTKSSKKLSRRWFMEIQVNLVL